MDDCQGKQGANRPTYRPHIQLVPLSLWHKNLRWLAPTDWKRLRSSLLDRHGLVCAMCGKTESEPKRLSAHEEWTYTEKIKTGVAKLAGVSLLCWHCHACEHFGNTQKLTASGTLPRAVDDTIAHFCRLNNVSEAHFHEHHREAAEDWDRRNRLTWSIDYGPFERWAFTTFKRDCLNNREWTKAQQRRWADAEPIWLEDVLASI